ncbi:MAG TPA: hypothetical protein VMW17_05805 [Candidatus Binatia bacterium]|nr:hypothetical protein [Candidatus Binatia bacterium]
MTRGTRWAIAVAAVVLISGGLALWRLRERATPPEILETAEKPLVLTSAPFVPWMRFENIQQHRQEYEQLYLDLVLGHQVFRLPPRGLSPQRARAMLLDDDDLLLSSGRRLWSREFQTGQPGMAGKFCYIHSDFCVRRLFEVYFVVDGTPIVIYDNMYTVERYPSRTVVRYALGTVQIDEHRYITWDDRAVSSYDVRSRDGRAHEVTIQVVSQNLTMPNSTGPTRYPVLGTGEAHGPLSVYLDAPGFEVADGYPMHLHRTLAVAPDGTAQRVNVAASFVAAQVGQSHAPLSPDVLERQVTDYQRWFFDNVPYFDAPDGQFKKMWYYRWWVVRFNLSEPNISDLKGAAFYEGKLGFDNLISFAAPAQIKELTYLRDPRFALQQAQNSYRNLSPEGALADASSSPYWGEMYSQWTTAAVADFNRVQPIDAATLRELLPAMASDVRAWMKQFDRDGDFLPSRDIPRITGYDLDILSYWFFSGLKLDLYAKPPDLERVDFASFVYANAAAIAELADGVGDRALVEEFAKLAASIRDAVLKKLWDPETKFFYPQRAADDARIPVRELHGFFPFTMRLAPDKPEYLEALRTFVDPDEFWARFPPVITSLAHYRKWTWDMNGLTRNIAPHPISMGALTLIRALHDYHQDIVTPAHFMDLMTRFTGLMYPGVHPNDPTWRPNAHEYYSEWEPGSKTLLPKPSDISHDFHSMYNVLIVEGVIGLTPRRDERIELRPAVRDWPYFALDRLRYHGHDLSIIWDQPDGQVRYTGYPEGFSLYIDGTLAFTQPTLDWVIYDPATHSTTGVTK